MFRMKEHKKIDDMFDRFSKIVNDLHALKKTYTDRDLVRKILRSLTSEWRSKADAIYESIGTSNVIIDGLRVKLVMKKFCKLLRKKKRLRMAVCAMDVVKPGTFRTNVQEAEGMLVTSKSKEHTSLGVATPAMSQVSKRKTKKQIFVS
ncbi:unnamed protein product [Cuscuta campestris]|uniref:UBN2 domain-containing protein n=1 Tax=Cuscuta campestris TaxID=132261 RepID=A0A484LEC9_9ASTE|nr:unnamed protein product [Cuscuta campestris]